MAKHEQRPTPDIFVATERDRRQIFEDADAAYRRAGATTAPDLKAWENALADGIPN